MNNYIKNLTKLNFNMEEVKVFDVFAGIGSLHQSLTELGVPIKITNLSEVDVDAIISYAGIHIENFKDLEFNYPSKDEMKQWLMDRNIGYDFAKQKSSIPRMKVDKLENVYKASILLNNLGDISQINYEEIEDFDLMNCSFCCQDLSGAGKQKGLKNEDGTPTRSGLVTYGLKAIRIKKPKYIMIENVKGLIQKKFIDDFYDITKEIESIGYNCYYPKKDNGQPTCLNAKNYGIPQNRERIFVICVRKDIDNGLFSFPQGFDNGLRLKDLLEDEVDEKYYLDKPWHFSTELDEKHDTNEIAQIEGIAYKATRSITDIDKICRCIDTMGGVQREPKIVCEQRCDEGLRFFKDNVCGSLRTIDSGGDKRIIEVGKQVMVKEATTKGYSIAEEGVANTLNCGCNQGTLDDCRIRKLTPRECWRLMGFRDEHIERAMALGMSNSQLYKQAGNSIVVDVLYCIFKELFKEYIME